MEIIKTDNPDIVIERTINEKEIDISKLNIRKAIIEEAISNINLLEIDENYPQEVKIILEEKNQLLIAERYWLELQLQEVNSVLDLL